MMPPGCSFCSAPFYARRLVVGVRMTWRFVTPASNGEHHPSVSTTRSPHVLH